MKTSTILGLIVVTLSLVGLWILTGQPTPASPAAITGAADYRNATYLIAGKPVTLVNGKAETVTTSDSASKETVAVFGEPILRDLDGDDDEDVLLLLTQNSGGSGTFYYAAVAINVIGTYVGTNALLLGDRIAPQTLGVQEGRAVVNYAVRADGESFAVKPSIGKSMRITLDSAMTRISEWSDASVAKPAKGPVQALDPSKMVKVTSPLKNQKVTSPLKISGQARGNWYFEASFPVAIIDADGVQLGVDVAQAKGDWMTTEFVPFEATLTFVKSATSTGILLLKRDNPSGKPEGDASISIPVRF